MLSFSGAWLNASSNEKILIRTNNSQMATEVFFTLLILSQSLPITPKQAKGKGWLAGAAGRVLCSISLLLKDLCDYF